VILNCKTKWLSLVDDEGYIWVIVGWNQGVSLRFISSLKLRKSMHKGCKLYVILVLNEKGVAEGLEHLLVLREFVDVFLEELPWMPPERELNFTIDLKSENRIDSENALSDVDPIFTNATERIVGPGTNTSKCVTMGCTSYFHTK
jgi:hypothetical protein